MARSLLLSLLLLAGSRLFAETCVAGSAGRMRFANSRAEYCNGTAWVSAANAMGDLCPSGQAGNVAYTNSIYQYCNGLNWISMKGSSVTTCTAANSGRQIYSSNKMQFCDGANYYDMSAPAATGYFLLTSSAFTPDFGGRVAGDQLCLRELRDVTWLGKGNAGPLSPNRVHAFLCDGSGCFNLKASTKYAMGRTYSSLFGGRTFTTNASGQGPADALSWDGSDAFLAQGPLWTGRAAGSATLWSTSSATKHCSGWTSSSGSVQGQTGLLTATTAARWSNAATACSGGYPIICAVDPLEEAPTAFAFTNQSGVAVNTLTTSNIVQINGLSGTVSLSLEGPSGSPQFRTCSDAACGTVVVNWTSTASTISSGQYLQLRMTSSTFSGTKFTESVFAGGGTADWTITTAGTPTGFLVQSVWTNPGGFPEGITEASRLCWDQVNATATGSSFQNQAQMGTLTKDRVRAFLCDSKWCEDPMPNSTYYLATLYSNSYGGQSFTTDATGLTGPGNTLAWSGTSAFGSATTAWTGRAAGSATAFPSVASANLCKDWTGSAASLTGDYGSSASTGSGRWIAASSTCNQSMNWMCMIDPVLTPAALTLSGVANSEVVSLTQSNIVAVSGLTGPAPVTISGVLSGASPQYRICADAACASVTVNWTAGKSFVSNGSYLQLQMTSAFSAGTPYTANFKVGTYSTTWTVTTAGASAQGRITYDYNPHTGNQGGLSGANANCASDNATSTTLTRAFLCDQTTCNNLIPNYSYKFDFGAAFTADASGTGPGVPFQFTSIYRLADGGTPFWSGRAAGTDNAWGAAAGSACSNWGSASSGVSGMAGHTAAGGTSRWNNGNLTCDQSLYMICLVHPDVFPSAFSFTAQTGVARGALATSNIVQVSGNGVPATVTISAASGAPQFRVCADSGCASVLKDWRSAPTLFTSGQYVQARVTSSATSTTATITSVTVGGTSGTWSVTTN